MHEEPDELVVTDSQKRSVERKMIVWPDDVPSCLAQIRSYLASLALDSKFFGDVCKIQLTANEWVEEEQIQEKKSFTKEGREESLEQARNITLFDPLEQSRFADSTWPSEKAFPPNIAPYTIDATPL